MTQVILALSSNDSVDSIIRYRIAARIFVSRKRRLTAHELRLMQFDVKKIAMTFAQHFELVRSWNKETNVSYQLSRLTGFAFSLDPFSLNLISSWSFSDWAAWDISTCFRTRALRQCRVLKEERKKKLRVTSKQTTDFLNQWRTVNTNHRK